jgi:hypothetical protein
MTNNHLTTFLHSLKTDLIHSMQAKGKYATGQTEQQITIEGDNNSCQLNLPAYIQALENGRSPTGKNATPGNPPMIDRIKQWCQAKGIPDKAAWAIKKSIDKKGYKGTPGIISEPLGDANINLRLNQAAEPMADAIATHLVDSIGLSGLG